MGRGCCDANSMQAHIPIALLLLTHDRDTNRITTMKHFSTRAAGNWSYENLFYAQRLLVELGQANVFVSFCFLITEPQSLNAFLLHQILSQNNFFLAQFFLALPFSSRKKSQKQYLAHCFNWFAKNGEGSARSVPIPIQQQQWPLRQWLASAMWQRLFFLELCWCIS